MIVSINQPAYLPWLGYFHRIAAADLHVVLDHVQFEKNSFVNRNRVATASGPTWLTVPVQTAGRFGDLAIDSLTIEPGTKWRRKHWETLRQSYSKAPFWSAHAEFFRDIYAREWESLLPLCLAITQYLLAALEMQSQLLSSSSLPLRSHKHELVLDICQHVGASTYLSGPLGRDYLIEKDFTRAGITLAYDDYKHPEYRQRAEGFESHLSIVDLLFNHGPDSREIMLARQ